MLKIIILISFVCAHQVSGFWDTATTTIRGVRTDDTPRQSFFRWQWISALYPRMFYSYDWDEIDRRRRLCIVAGMSIDFLCITTATILNRRVLISAYNPFDEHMNRQDDLRIWALGRTGRHTTPYRYRVFRVHRLFPLSPNPEHCHGPHCTHQPRHDVCIIVCQDMMYLNYYYPTRAHYAYRAHLTGKYQHLSYDLWFAGSGYEYIIHLLENYKIFFTYTWKSLIRDCSIYIPKWWGKFICIINWHKFPGVQNGGGLYSGTYIQGLGCFELRVRDDRVYVFTDLRYYFHQIHHFAYVWPGQYYEYAYPQWSVKYSMFYITGNTPYIPAWQIQEDTYPMGK